MLAEKIKMRMQERRKRIRYGLNDRQREVAEKLKDELRWARIEAALKPQKVRV